MGDAVVWRSDGTQAGTGLAITPAGSDRLRIGAFGDPSGTLYLIVQPRLEDAALDMQLWRSDGTQAGTTEVADLGHISQYAGLTLVAHQGVLYFAVHRASSRHPSALWRSDGTPEGTIRLMTAPGIPGEPESSRALRLLC